MPETINPIRKLFDLTADQDSQEAIRQQIMANIASVGSNLWVLIFAIVLASLGLNLNSSAVIIGAMLISPLMGPIVAIGYGAGIADFSIINTGFRSFIIMVVISLGAATLFFIISPLSSAQSELLARTSPTLYDVLIAFFGGAAGIVAITRKEISNVVPGVAIATALMPPLCTAGFGIANGNGLYFFGAIYLFLINTVFIAFATFVFVRIMRLKRLSDVDPLVTKRKNIIILVVTLFTAIPSVYLAYKLVLEERFLLVANRLITRIESDNNNIVVINRRIDAKDKRIVLTVSGDKNKINFKALLANAFIQEGLPARDIIIKYIGGNFLDIASLKKDILDSNDIKASNKQYQQFELTNEKINSFIISKNKFTQDIINEFPEFSNVKILNEVVDIPIGFSNEISDRVPSELNSANEINQKPLLLLLIETNSNIKSTEVQRLARRLSANFEKFQTDIIIRKVSKAKSNIN